MAEIRDYSNNPDPQTADRWPEGMAMSSVNDTGRTDEGIIGRWEKDINGSLVTTGTASAYVLTPNRDLTSSSPALYDGLILAFKPHLANDANATLNVQSQGALPIKNFSGENLDAGYFEVDKPVWVAYSSLDSGAWIVQSYLDKVTPADRQVSRATSVQATYRQSVYDVTDSDFGADRTGATAASDAIIAAIDRAAAASPNGGIVYVPYGNYLLDKQIPVKTRIRLEGDNRRSAILTADPTNFPINTPMIRLGDGTSIVFETTVEHLKLECNNRTGVSGVYSTEANEGCGVFHSLITNCPGGGILFEGSTVQHAIVDNVEINAGTAGPDYAIFIDAVGGDMYLSRITTNAQDTNPYTDGIRVNSAIVTIMNYHVEAATNGVNVIGGSIYGMDISGSSNGDVTNLVTFGSGSNGNQALFMMNTRRSDRICVNDQLQGITVSDQILPYYMTTSGVGARKTLITGSKETPDRIEKATASNRFDFFSADNATPDVKSGNNFKTANTVLTTITNFINGVNGQEIWVVINDNFTEVDFRATNSNLRGNNSQIWQPQQFDHMTCKFDNNRWFCTVSDN